MRPQACSISTILPVLDRFAVCGNDDVSGRSLSVLTPQADPLPWTAGDDLKDQHTAAGAQAALAQDVGTDRHAGDAHPGALKPRAVQERRQGRSAKR